VIYYHRYPADYAIGAGDLSMIEDGAYTRLMDFYYGKEEPIQHARRFNVARATSPAEKRAVDLVLERFFYREGDVWRHERVEEEIAKAQPRIEAARANGKKGGRPRKNPAPNPPDNPPGFQQESQWDSQRKPGGETSHTSYVNNSVGDSSTSEYAFKGTDAQARAVVDAAKALRRMGVKGAGVQSPDLINLVLAGHSAETIVLTASELALRAAGMYDDPDLHPDLVELFANGAEASAMNLTGVQVSRLRGCAPNLAYVHSTVIGRARDAAQRSAQSQGPPAPRTSGKKPSATDQIEGKTYAGTDVDNLPPEIRSRVAGSIPTRTGD
jgi:uncharacterized protein YdaU (DUF1376 family)